MLAILKRSAFSAYDSYFSLEYDVQTKPHKLRSKSLDNSQELGNFLSRIEKRAFRRAQIATGNTDDALDIVQDAMLSLVNKYAHKSTEDWELLFHKILSSRIMDWHRKTALRKRFGVWFSSASDESEQLEQMEFEDTQALDPELLTETKQSISLLEGALHELPLKQQQVFLLRAWEGLTEKETARAMSCSVGTVKSHYARARSFLKNKLGNV
jgi:RNA polymerase sigma-70 factor (ECF subfamily)